MCKYQKGKIKLEFLEKVESEGGKENLGNQN
jgi:hypothetical protein